MVHLAFYFGSSCYDRFLPDLPVWNERIRIPAALIGQGLDLMIPVRALEDQVFIQPPRGMSWDQSNSQEEKNILPGETLRLKGREAQLAVRMTETSRAATIMRKYQLPAGRSISLGSDDANDICADDAMLSSLHGELLLNNGVCAYQDRSKNGTYVNGNRVSRNRVTLRLGDVISIGEMRIVWLGAILAISNPAGLKHVRLPLEQKPRQEIALTRQEDTASVYQEFHRAPRIVEMPEVRAIKIEAPASKNPENTQPLWMTIGPSATMILPMMLSGLVTGRDMLGMGVMMGGSAALAVTWGLINANYRKKNSIITEEKRQANYRRYIAEMEDELSALTEKERLRVNEQYQSLDRCLALPSTKRRLWERMTTHDDFLCVRLGTGDRPLPSTIEAPEEKLSMVDDELRDEPARLKNAYSTIHEAPVTVDLKAHPVVGVIGSRRNPHLLQSIIVQLAATHSYHDVRICIVTGERTASQWTWAKWLPHVYLDDDRSLRLLVTEEERIPEVMSELENIHSMRAEYLGERPDEEKERQTLPRYVIICTDPQLIEKLPITKRVIDRPLGFTLVMLAASVDRLPKETDLIIQASEQLGAVYTNRGGLENVRFEFPNRDQLEQFSHALAPVRVTDATESTAIPSIVSFLENYHVRDIADLDVWRFWNENHAYDGLKAVVGLASGSQPFVLDISDKAQSHGPHGLVAGTTGSGKSVMLQTYILSLAVNYSPQEVQFILIDYKGGGTAQVFEDMPHIAGIIDNQEGEKTIQRALASIKGEIGRREQAFKRLKITHIDEYIRYFNNDPAEKPLAHLIVVVDEFAEMAKEQPEFMKELISTARVGRTLGMHLILATQKPSNSVNDEIWSNTRFRICLRVATRGDSNDMLKRPDAAYLRGMGRCYVQVGNDEIFEQVQTSYSGADYAPAELSAEERPRLLSSIGQTVRIQKSAKRSDGEKETQMSAVLRRIRTVADDHHLANAHRLWLEPVRSRLLLEEVPAMQQNLFDGKHWPAKQDEELTAWYGLIDNTLTQRYELAGVDFIHNHDHLILGPAATGKTTLIQTIAISLALRYSPEKVNMYIFSLTSSTLDTLRDLPHVGDVVTKNHPDEAVRLLQLVMQEEKRRRKLFESQSTDSFGQYNRIAAARADVDALPAMVVMIDRLSSLITLMNEDLLKDFIHLLAESASVGIYFLATALNWTNDEVPVKMKESFTGIALNVGDRDIVREILNISHPIPAESVNISQVPGRGLSKSGGEVFESQAAVYGSVDDMERAERITALVQQMAAAWKGKRPEGIIRIPDPFTTASMKRLPGCDPAAYPAGQLPIAISKLMGVPVVHSFWDACAMTYVGPSQSGKTTAMLATAELLRAQGAKVYTVGKSALMMEWAAARPDVTTFAPDSAELTAFFNDTMFPETMRRIDILKELGHKPKELEKERKASMPPIVIAIDDLRTMAAANSTNGTCTLIGNTAARGNGINIIYLFAITGNELGQMRTSEPMRSVLEQNRGIVLGGWANSVWNAQAPLEIKRLRLPLGEALYLSADGYVHVAVPNL